jgi:uncharacterized membrane protein YiaA
MSDIATARPTPAFIGASWVALLLGSVTFVTSLANASMGLAEKGFYLVLLMYGLYSAVSLQKAVRDKAEGIAVSALYFGISWLSVGIVFSLLGAGLWNADWTPEQKGFYGMAFALSLFAAVAVQKNVRDLAAAGPAEDAADRTHWAEAIGRR